MQTLQALNTQGMFSLKNYPAADAQFSGAEDAVTQDMAQWLAAQQLEVGRRAVTRVLDVATGGGRTLQVRIEAFNVPNRANFATPSGRIAFTGVAADGSPVVAPTWGRITSTVTTSRQIQVGAKVAF